LLSNVSATLTQTVANALSPLPLTLSTQKGKVVSPSSSVNLKSPPSSFAAGKSAECPPKSKFSPVALAVAPIRSLTW